MKGWKRREKKDQRGMTCAETGFCEGGGGEADKEHGNVWKLEL